MKKILKLYKMFYRLLRLKHWQRQEIINHERFCHNRIVKQIYDEYFGVKLRLDDYERVMKFHRINSPFDLCIALEGLEFEENTTRTQYLHLRDCLERNYKEWKEKFTENLNNIP